MTKYKARSRIAKAGRPRKAGTRFPGGKLKPAGPNEILLARRKELCADPTKASCPLDAAHARGWLTNQEYMTGIGFARLHRLVNTEGPGRSITQRMTEVATPIEVSESSFSRMSNKEIATLWDAVFTDGPPPSEQLADAATAALRDAWRRAVASMTREQFAEVDLVCVQESWPQWIIQRAAGRMDTSWEAKHRLLTEGLAVIRACRPQRVLGPKAAPARSSVEAVGGETETTRNGVLIRTATYRDTKSGRRYRRVTHTDAKTGEMIGIEELAVKEDPA